MLSDCCVSSGTDDNSNGLPDGWEDFWGLDSDDPDLPDRDPDGDDNGDGG
jgi:hypothetical protein